MYFTKWSIVLTLSALVWRISQSTVRLVPKDKFNHQPPLLPHPGWSGSNEVRRILWNWPPHATSHAGCFSSGTSWSGTLRTCNTQRQIYTQPFDTDHYIYKLSSSLQEEKYNFSKGDVQLFFPFSKGEVQLFFSLFKRRTTFFVPLLKGKEQVFFYLWLSPRNVVKTTQPGMMRQS